MYTLLNVTNGLGKWRLELFKTNLKYLYRQYHWRALIVKGTDYALHMWGVWTKKPLTHSWQARSQRLSLITK
jgi:hypothetical protein